MRRSSVKPQPALSCVPILLMLALLAPWQPVVGAGGEIDGLDPYPLQPANTSSPRDTLRGFLADADELIAGYKQTSAFNPELARTYLRAVEHLDLSSTPHSDAWGVRTGRMLLLKEILDRIQLPPDSEIPGVAEVAESGLSQWTIPGARITIKRIEDGPQAGEFLFSADTVQRLHRLYAHAKHLPYKPGATAGAYEQWANDQETKKARDAQIRSRLKPVDTSNPRSTLEGFLWSLNRAYRLVTKTDAALQATPPEITRAEAKEVEIVASNLLQRALATLDLSQVPEAVREDVGAETVLQLKEIMDRMQLPPVDTVPDARMVQAAKQQDGADAIRWRYPNTEMEIVEITAGERQGQFLFSADTVKRASDFYAQVKDLPYRTGFSPIDWMSPDTSEGLYDYYISTPGYMVHRIHFLGRLIEDLPAGLKTIRGGQTYWQWLGLLLSVLLVALAGYSIGCSSVRQNRLSRRWGAG